jgi:hypothetical protein
MAAEETVENAISEAKNASLGTSFRGMFHCIRHIVWMIHTIEHCSTGGYTASHKVQAATLSHLSTTSRDVRGQPILYPTQT